MSTAHDKIQRAAFDAIEFPVSSVEVMGGLRDHVHEYPHQDGGDPELLGRKLYVIRMRALFHRRFLAYPDLYPGRLDKLRAKWEAGTTAGLVIPTIGTMRAYCFNWNQKLEAKIRSGQAVELEFREKSAKTIASTFKVTQLAAGLGEYMVILGDAVKPDMVSIFDAMQLAVNAVTAYLDTAGMYGNLLESKLLQLKRVLEEFHRLDGMQDAENYAIWNALQEIGRTTQALADNLQNQAGGLAEWTTPEDMTVQQISVALYDGDATRAMDILQLNPIEDAFKVPAGFTIRYYPRSP